MKCHVCAKRLKPVGLTIRFEGIVDQSIEGTPWVWGPVPVHDRCREDLTTEFDDRIGDRYVVKSEFR